MKLPHIASYLYHYPQSCGTTFAARGLSRGLARLGCRTTVYGCGSYSECLTAENEEYPQRRVSWHRPERGLNPFHVPAALLNRLRHNQDAVDLLLIHGNFNPRNVAVARAAQAGGIPYIACPSSLFHKELFRRHRVRKFAYGRLFERPLLNGAAAVQVFTETQIEALAKYGVHRPVFVSPNGFDPAEVPQRDETPFAPMVESSGPTLTYLGRIDMYTKGLDLLFQAIAKGTASGQLPRDLRLDLTGPDWGDELTLRRMAAESQISDRIHFRGRVGDRERWAVVYGAEIMILPSRHDSFPTVILEAMAVGKPVILSSEAGIAPFIKKSGCGFLVEPTVESIQQGIAEALRCRAEWQEMGFRGQEFAHRTFTWDIIASQALEHYQQILGKRVVAEPAVMAAKAV